MHIGIVVYSQTGHTLAVAEKLKETLAASGHRVTLEQVETVGAVSPAATQVTLKTSPEIEPYDALVLGTCVRGGEPALPMASYLALLPSLQSRKVACLATGFFPVASWGRDQTLARMKEVLEAKGATVCGSGSVGWFSLSRRRQIVELVEAFSKLF
jgi:menaquinone-dependent protoporphyrinogen IX oxidase